MRELSQEPFERTAHHLQPRGVDGRAEAMGASLDQVVLAVVKWFDTSKGFGFVVPETGGRDILVHYNLLAPLGRKSLPEGARLSVIAQEGPRGLQAVRILTIDLPPEPEPVRSTDKSSRLDPLDFLGEAGPFAPATVRWFNRSKGYGFILLDDGQTQAFIHAETARRGGFDSLEPDLAVEVRVARGPRGPLVVEIRRN